MAISAATMPHMPADRATYQAASFGRLDCQMISNCMKSRYAHRISMLCSKPAQVIAFGLGDGSAQHSGQDGDRQREQHAFGREDHAEIAGVEVRVERHRARRWRRNSPSDQAGSGPAAASHGSKRRERRRRTGQAADAEPNDQVKDPAGGGEWQVEVEAVVQWRSLGPCPRVELRQQQQHRHDRRQQQRQGTMPSSSQGRIGMPHRPPVRAWTSSSARHPSGQRNQTSGRKARRTRRRQAAGTPERRADQQADATDDPGASVPPSSQRLLAWQSAGGCWESCSARI